MGKKYKDIEIGDVYGRWTVIGKGNKVGKRGEKYVTCKCSCDKVTIREVSESSLKQGRSTSCGCLAIENSNKTILENKKYEDIIIGKSYGKWTAIKKGRVVKSKKGYRRYWLCKCSCEYETIKEVREDGLLNGTSKGCKKCSLKKDLTGKIFGDLKVLRLNTEVHSGYNHTFYDVECKCGKVYPVRSDALTCGTTTNCGCNQLEHIDLVGQKFGMLTVLEYMYRYSYSDTKDYNASVNFWKCQCDCGNIISKRQNNLIGMNGLSCGCDIRSKGEREVKRLLDIWNFKYIEQHRFDDCKHKNTLPFDFVLLDKNDNIYGAIEFDGEFHYNSIKWGDMTQEDADENLRTTVIRDNIKNEYCKSNNIPLIRIPYWEMENIEYILFDQLVKYGVIEEIKSA